MPIVLLATLFVSQSPSELQELREGPIDFRCDYGQAYSEPSRWVCRKNVIVRRGDLLVCCDTFEGYRSERGAWERFVCQDNVRAQRGLELMWADRATFILETSDLILTGHPMVQRAGSVLRGERIVIDVEYDQARVEQPRGRLEPAETPSPTEPPSALEGPLPKRCPIRSRPDR